ncbi:NagC family transcriptional regulator, partial [Pantoea ananatis]
MVHGYSAGHEVELNRSEKLILELVRRNDGISRSSLVSQTILNQSSVHRIVDTLTENGFLSLGESPSQGRGKPSPSLSLNANARYGYGISINSDSVAASLINFRGGITEYCVLDTHPRDPARTLLNIKHHYLDTLKQYGISPDKVCGVGYSMAG